MKLITRILSLIAVLLVANQGLAYDFEVGGIHYNIISASKLEVEVTSRNFNYIDSWSHEDNNSYSGIIEIPNLVNYNNRTYKVVGIGDYAFGCKIDGHYGGPVSQFLYRRT